MCTYEKLFSMFHVHLLILAKTLNQTHYHWLLKSTNFKTLLLQSTTCVWSWNAWSTCRNGYRTRTLRIIRHGTNCPTIRIQRVRCVSMKTCFLYIMRKSDFYISCLYIIYESFMLLKSTGHILTNCFDRIFQK